MLKDEETTGLGRKIKKGESEKIDRINELVNILKRNNNDKESLLELWELYEKLIHKIIHKWQKYYKDEDGTVIPYDDLYQDAFMWFRHYTIEKFEPTEESIIGKRATFGIFIKSHMDSRIRFIYQKEFKRRSREMLAPESDTSLTGNIVDDFLLSNNIEKGLQESTEDYYFNKISKADRILVARKIDNYLQLTSKDANKYSELILHDKELCEKLTELGLPLEAFLDLLSDDDKLVDLYCYLKGE